MRLSGEASSCSSKNSSHHILSMPTLSNRCHYSLALVIFLARCLLYRHYGARWRCSVGLGFWSLGDLGGLGRFDRRELLLYPPMLLFLYLFLLLFVLLLFLLLGFDNGALGERSELLVYGFKLKGERKTDELMDY